MNDGAHGSFRCRPTRVGAVFTVNAAGSSLGVSSVHDSGIETGAPGRARVEKAATDVFVRLLRM